MWNKFWKDLSTAMLMTDPMAYGLHLAWSLEARGQREQAVAAPFALRQEPARFGPRRRPSPAGADGT
jgi:hypothetical protein